MCCLVIQIIIKIEWKMIQRNRNYSKNVSFLTNQNKALLFIVLLETLTQTIPKMSHY